ncbi:YggS family pyridoxal phosphate-dependent enzyme [Curvibacter sp. RS43]|uniref:YggS family pyridoxal phosphate-dependent enzyme n=1 Tax=Curvibacter microcysteis TaxID=3026419 RepID=UPI002360CB7F|nr:YggS family pyridoxal phosphate-dependent enzyme [Curvibacter sp. RS43]MDD0811600.1 YggS family pyridoxal phosphate-dependent enzyme [Curvibacter sp. RS43]
MTMIVNKLHLVRDRIHQACQDAGRDPASVQLLAVSKTFGPEAVREAAAAGQTAFGENYLQEGVDKMAALDAPPHPLLPRPAWHCIGPVQSNKTKLVATHFDWLHTLDRLKIAQRLNEQRGDDQAPLQVCLQVNIDGGANKSGLAPQEVLPLARAVLGLPRLRLRGLMTIPEPQPDFESQKQVHLQARALFDLVRQTLLEEGLPGAADFDTLSMGMTGDLEAAIHAGSTMVRVGSAIFGGRSYPAAT